ncbi:MAG: hypothetical protein H8E55_00265 [Pelagibacterales bacterium]|nr:hypothetical protein [Pelagibacterales bacterium]
MGKKKIKIRKEIKDLVIARLGILPLGKKISIGSSGEFTKEQLIDHVEKEDDIGEKITEIELAYLQAIKEGIFYEQDFSDYQAKI